MSPIRYLASNPHWAHFFFYIRVSIMKSLRHSHLMLVLRGVQQKVNVHLCFHCLNTKLSETCLSRTRMAQKHSKNTKLIRSIHLKFIVSFNSSMNLIYVCLHPDASISTTQSAKIRIFTGHTSFRVLVLYRPALIPTKSKEISEKKHIGSYVNREEKRFRAY